MRSALLYYRKQHWPAAAALLHALERGWHRLRQLKARLQGRAGCAAEFDAHTNENKLVRAGGQAGLFSAILCGWTGGRFRDESQPVTREIKE